jgi:hypothetical protein
MPKSNLIFIAYRQQEEEILMKEEPPRPMGTFTPQAEYRSSTGKNSSPDNSNLRFYQVPAEGIDDRSEA